MNNHNLVIFDFDELYKIFIEIKKHINFASNCFQHNKIILAICWGLQVCSAAAGVKVEPSICNEDVSR